MSRHHLQGVEMANLVPERSTDPEVRQLAFDIAETQQNQVGRMQGWLALWGLPPTGGDTMAWMAPAEGAGGDEPGAGGGGGVPGVGPQGGVGELGAPSGAGVDGGVSRLVIPLPQG